MHQLLVADGNLKENFPLALGFAILVVLVIAAVAIGADVLLRKLRH